MKENIIIESRDYWFKVVEMLQQNWALIDEMNHDSVKVYFVDDGSGVFDEIDFSSLDEAKVSLKRNGFDRYEDDEGAKEFLRSPNPPFYRSAHPNGFIYSSGRFWR